MNQITRDNRYHMSVRGYQSYSDPLRTYNNANEAASAPTPSMRHEPSSMRHESSMVGSVVPNTTSLTSKIACSGSDHALSHTSAPNVESLHFHSAQTRILRSVLMDLETLKNSCEELISTVKEIVKSDEPEAPLVERHVFIDNTNIFLSAKNALPGSTRLDIRAFTYLLETGVELSNDSPTGEAKRHRFTGKRIVVGSCSAQTKAIWDNYRQFGYETRTETNIHNGREKNVDVCLHSAMQSLILEQKNKNQKQAGCESLPRPRPQLVLATGDGNNNNGEENFPDIIRHAVAENFDIKIYSYRDSLSKQYLKLRGEFPSDVTICYLDTCSSVTQSSRSNSPTEACRSTTSVPCRPVLSTPVSVPAPSVAPAAASPPPLAVAATALGYTAPGIASSMRGSIHSQRYDEFYNVCFRARFARFLFEQPNCRVQLNRLVVMWPMAHEELFTPEKLFGDKLKPMLNKNADLFEVEGTGHDRVACFTNNVLHNPAITFRDSLEYLLCLEQNFELDKVEIAHKWPKVFFQPFKPESLFKMTLEHLVELNSVLFKTHAPGRIRLCPTRARQIQRPPETSLPTTTHSMQEHHSSLVGAKKGGCYVS